jgi:hypothetical protein
MIAASAIVLVGLATSTACTHRAIVADVYMSIDSDGSRHRTEFFTDTESIYCIAKIVAAPMGTTVDARLLLTESTTAPTPQLLALGEDVVGASDTKATDTFQVLKPSAMMNGPWPVGRFECDILIDGEAAASTTFAITMPSCPLYPAQEGVPCAGFYPPDARCPAALSTQTCVCDVSGSWKC